MKNRFQVMAMMTMVLGLLLGKTSSTLGQQKLKVKLRTGDSTILIAENQGNHEQVPLVVGQRLKYKTVTSGTFQKGRIISISDSTISFEINGHTDSVIISQKDLMGLKLRRHGARSIVGSAFIVLGSIGVISFAADPGTSDASGVSAGLRAIAIGAGVPLLAIGIALKVPRKIDLTGKWKLNPPGGAGVTPIFAAPLPREYKKFKVTAGGGYAAGIAGASFYAEPMYRFNDRFSVGLKYEFTSGTVKSRIDSFRYPPPAYLPVSYGSSNSSQGIAINSLSLSFLYYFSTGNFRPFVSAGFGYYSLGAGSTFTLLYPRAGFEYNQFIFSVDYNMLPELTGFTDTSYVSGTFTAPDGSTYPVYTAQNFSTVAERAYVGIKVGYIFGGGKK